MAAEELGGLSIPITADFSGLDADFESAVAIFVAKGATLAEAIQQALQIPDTTPVTDAFAAVGEAAQQVAEQLGLFEAATQIDFSDAVGQLNLFTTELEPIAGAVVSSTAALSALEAAIAGLGAVTEPISAELDAVRTAAENYAGSVASVVNAQKDADDELKTAQTTLAAIQQLYADGAVDANTLARAAQDVQSAFASANPAIEQSKTAIQDTSTAAEAASTAFSGMVSILGALGVSLSLAGLVDFAQGVGEAADSITRASISMTALTGDATEAADTLGKLAELGVSDGLAMPSLRQAAATMTTLLPEGTDVVSILSQLADASGVTGKSVESLANIFDRLVNATTLMPRQLASFGTNLDQIKQAMEDAGVSAGIMADGVTKAWGELDQHDKIVVLQTALQKFQGVAEDVANNTFAGAWHQAMAQWDTDIGIVQKDLGGLIGSTLGGGLKDGINLLAEGFVTLGTMAVAAFHSIKGGFDELSIELQAAGQASVQALAGNWTGAAATITTAWAQVAVVEKQTQDKVAADMLAGGKIILDIMNQAHGSIKPVIDDLDGLGVHGKSAAEQMAAAIAAVQKFDALATSGDAGITQLQTAFENASKAINKVATADLPLAIKAVQDYMAAQMALGASTPILMAGFTEESKLLNQLGKVDAQAAADGFINLTKQILATAGNALPLLNAAVQDTEKYINTLAKTDLEGAISESNKFIDTLAAGGAKVNILTDALTNQQKLLDNLAKTSLTGAIDGLGQLADKAVSIKAPMQEVSNILDDMRSKLDTLAKTNLQGAIDGLDQLADREVKLKVPTQEVTATLDDERSKLDLLANVNLEAAISGLDKLAIHQIALNQPTQDVTRTLDDERSKLDLLANTNIEAAIAGLDRLATQQIKLNQPTQDVTRTLDDERSKLDLLASVNLQKAIDGLDQLADKQIKLNQPTQEVTKTLDDERSKLDLLANTNLQGAISGLDSLADKQIKLNQPTKDVTATLDDERAKIVLLGDSNIPAAIGAIQGLIDKQIALKQPITDINTSLKVESDFLQKEATTDLPAAIAGHQTYLNTLIKENELYVAINAAGLQTVQQQEFQIASQKQLLDAVDGVNLAYGDRLTLEAKIAQEEINLDQAQGQNVSDQILGLEKIKLEQQALIINTHGMADAIVASIGDVLKGFDQVGQSIANVIVNGGKLGDALVADFKKIATSILGDLITGALKPLEADFIKLINNLLPDTANGLKVVGESVAQVTEGFKNETDAINATVDGIKSVDATAKVASNSMDGLAGASKSAASALTTLAPIITAVAAVVGAIAGIVGDVYLAAIDTKLFTTNSTLLSIFNQITNLRADQWQQYGDIYYQGIGQIWVKLDAILKAIQSSAGGPGGLSAVAQSDLDTTAANSTEIIHDLETINQNLIGILTDENLAVAGLVNINDSVQAVVSDDAVMIGILNQIVTSLIYGTQSAQMSAQQMSADMESWASGTMSANTDLIGAVDGNTAQGHADFGSMVNAQIAAAQAARDAAASQYAAATSIAAQVDALKAQEAADNQLADLLAKQGETDLANTYRAESANIQRQVIALIPQIGTVVTSVQRVYDATVTTSAQVATGSSAIVAAVYDSAAIVSNAVAVAVAAAGAYSAVQGTTGRIPPKGSTPGSSGPPPESYNPGNSNNPTGNTGQAPGGGAGGGQSTGSLPSNAPPPPPPPQYAPIYDASGNQIPVGSGQGQQHGTFDPIDPFTWPSNLTQAQQTAISNAHVPSFDQGGNIPQDMFAMVHKDEMVLPPDLSSMLRQMAIVPPGSRAFPGYANTPGSAQGTVINMPVTFNGVTNAKQLLDMWTERVKLVVPGAKVF